MHAGGCPSAARRPPVSSERVFAPDRPSRHAPGVAVACDAVARTPPAAVIDTFASAALRHCLEEDRRLLEAPPAVLEGEQPALLPPEMAGPTLRTRASPSIAVRGADISRSGQSPSTRSTALRRANHYRLRFRLACDGGNPRAGRDLDRARIPTRACGVTTGWASPVKERLMTCRAQRDPMPIRRTPAPEFPKQDHRRHTPADESPKDDLRLIRSPVRPPLGPPPVCLTAGIRSGPADEGGSARRGRPAPALRKVVRAQGCPAGEGPVRRRSGSGRPSGRRRGKAGFGCNPWGTDDAARLPIPPVQRWARVELHRGRRL